MQPQIASAPSCAEGVHQPRREKARDEGGVRRTTCRACGCRLVRTAATRRWFVSAYLA